ncbi:MFS transporter [Tepidanaerobacter sp. GT38]|uniref:MFS transporter n=1 Tax=Tepidanaerobacter sp. GT38 TaxID=2722793 RepID=UPI001F008C9B|nr:MFS transporter [Tepidanaerobacter sp. GT38]MCG1012856.1 MFS transporter [Tepidanaerobacter sp. GT38]
MKKNDELKNFAVVLAATIAFISTYYIMMPVIPEHMLYLGFDNLTIGTVMGLFSISSMIARPVGGAMINTYGSKKVMFISIILFFLTPLLIKMPYAILGLSLTLLIYGFTVGTFTVASANFTAEIASSENLTRFMGYNSISFIIAKGLSPALGTKLMEKSGFNAAVLSTLMVAIIAMVLLFFLSEVKTTKQSQTTSNFIKVLLNRSVYLPTIILFCGMVTFGAISAMLPLFAVAKGITGTEYFFIINTAVVVATRLFIGKWSNRYLEELIAIALAVLTLSFISMSFVDSFPKLVVAAMIYGVGFALLFPLMNSLLVINIYDVSRSMALGVFTAAFDLGVAAGVMLGGLSEYIDFKWLYLYLAILPFIGFCLYQYVYRPFIREQRIKHEKAS